MIVWYSVNATFIKYNKQNTKAEKQCVFLPSLGKNTGSINLL